MSFQIGDRIICIKSKYGNEGKIAEVLGEYDGHRRFPDTKGGMWIFTHPKLKFVARSLGTPLNGRVWQFEVSPINPSNWKKLPILTELNEHEKQLEKIV